MKPGILRIVPLLALAGAAGGALAQSAAAERLPNVERLLNQSSGARQVLDGGDRAALARREQAVDAFRRARDLIAAGDDGAAGRLLDESSRLMFEAIRLATPKSLGEGQQIDNYGARRESVVSLREAFDRISTESGERESRERVGRQLDEVVGRADALLREGRNADARVEIDKAYHLLKLSIESIRSGQTLVRSLRFETREAEYDYEIDRNDTHIMLVDLLIGEKRAAPAMQRQIVDLVAEARLLRQQAENFAHRDGHEQAIELLEQSTRQLVRAIRSAGIYIPG